MNEGEKSANELFEAHDDSAMIFDLHEKNIQQDAFLCSDRNRCIVLASLRPPSIIFVVIILYTYYTRYARFLQDVIRFLSNDCV